MNIVASEDVDAIEGMLVRASSAYHRLLVVVQRVDAPPSGALRAAAFKRGAEVMNLNLILDERLAPLSKAERHAKRGEHSRRRHQDAQR